MQTSFAGSVRCRRRLNMVGSVTTVVRRTLGHGLLLYRGQEEIPIYVRELFCFCKPESQQI